MPTSWAAAHLCLEDTGDYDDTRLVGEQRQRQRRHRYVFLGERLGQLSVTMVGERLSQLSVTNTLPR